MELSQIDSDNMRDVTTAVYGHNPLVEHILQEHKFLDHLFKVYEELPTDTPADQKLKLVRTRTLQMQCSSITGGNSSSSGSTTAEQQQQQLGMQCRSLRLSLHIDVGLPLGLQLTIRGACGARQLKAAGLL